MAITLHQPAKRSVWCLIKFNSRTMRVILRQYRPGGISLQRGEKSKIKRQKSKNFRLQELSTGSKGLKHQMHSRSNHFFSGKSKRGERNVHKEGPKGANRNRLLLLSFSHSHICIFSPAYATLRPGPPSLKLRRTGRHYHISILAN